MTTDEAHALVKSLSQDSKAELIETHISWVILTEKHAYKFKKPIRYSFINYAKLLRRKFYCEREVELNGRYSNIYLDVVPVYRTGPTIQLNEGVELIDYGVKMERVDHSYQMDVMLDEDKVTEEHMIKLANKLASFHQESEVIKKPFLAWSMSQRFNDIRSVQLYLSKELGYSAEEQINEAIHFSNQFINAHTSLLESRIKEGFTRDLHGDLHAKNIFLMSDPILFDCIEFSDQHRQIDILNEIAFLCMDLEAKDRGDLSQSFLTTYLGVFPVIRNDEDEQLFSYYKCYRANVRAKVNALRARQATSKSEEAQWLDEVSHYLDLMIGYVSQFSEANQLEHL